MELPIDPPTWFPDSLDQWTTGNWEGQSDCVVRDDTFLIGNHSDELTVSLHLHRSSLSLLKASHGSHYFHCSPQNLSRTYPSHAAYTLSIRPLTTLLSRHRRTRTALKADSKKVSKVVRVDTRRI